MIKHKPLLLIVICILLTGCWDSIGIEDRGFVVGTTIDLHDNTEELIVTNQFVIPAGLTGPSQQASGEKPYLNLSLTGQSINTINHEITALTSKVPYYQHLNVLIISESVAKRRFFFADTLDSFLRNVNINRGIKVLIAKDMAKDLLDITTDEQMLPAEHINKLLEQTVKHAGFSKQEPLGDIDESVIVGNSFILPYIEYDEEIKLNSGAVFHGEKNQMVGLFNEDEMIGLQFTLGTSKNRVINTNYKEYPLAYKIKTIESDIKINTDDINNLQVTINVKTDGAIQETIGYTDLLDTNRLESIERSISEEIESYIQKAIKKGHQELNTDVFQLHTNLKSYHYNTWKKVRKDWDFGENYFSKASFKIDIHTDITDIGTTNKTDRKRRR